MVPEAVTAQALLLPATYKPVRAADVEMPVASAVQVAVAVLQVAEQNNTLPPAPAVYTWVFDRACTAAKVLVVEIEVILAQLADDDAHVVAAHSAAKPAEPLAPTAQISAPSLDGVDTPVKLTVEPNPAGATDVHVDEVLAQVVADVQATMVSAAPTAYT